MKPRSTTPARALALTVALAAMTAGCPLAHRPPTGFDPCETDPGACIDAGTGCAHGETRCGSACVVLTEDPAHCGICGTVCEAAANADGRCTAGACSGFTCHEGFADCDGDGANGCETMGTCAVDSCRQVPPGSASGVYTLVHGGAPFRAYCDMETHGGGWTLALKVDGTQPTFRYEAEHWTMPTVLNDNAPDLDRTEAKLASFNVLPFTEVMLVLVDPRDQMPRSLRVIASSPSLRELFATESYVETQLGVDVWRGLLQSTSMQPDCNREGFNVLPDDRSGSRVRFGLMANNGDCRSTNSRIGIGGAGSTGGGCNPSGAEENTAGNVAGCDPDNGNVVQPAFGYLFVR